jgi:hypothetical protein
MAYIKRALTKYVMLSISVGRDKGELSMMNAFTKRHTLHGYTLTVTAVNTDKSDQEASYSAAKRSNHTPCHSS